MNDEVRKLLDKLLMKVNRVTCPHRHGQGIPRQALDDLSNYQIDVEDELNKMDGDNTCPKCGRNKTGYPRSLNFCFETDDENCKLVQVSKQNQGGFPGIQQSETVPVSPLLSGMKGCCIPL